MRDRRGVDANGPPARTRRRGRGMRREHVRCDLERRGVPSPYAASVAVRLTSIAADLSDDEYVAVVDSVAAASGIDAGSPDDVGHDAFDMGGPLVCDLAEQLRRLDEGLSVLSAYVKRMTQGAEPGPPPQPS